MSKSCFVPGCGNTSINSNKIFITVPFKEDMRREWCKAVKREKVPKASSGRIFCCEDHFNLENDCENWVHYKLMQDKIILKKGVVPHLNLSESSGTSKEYSQLSDSAKKRKSENIQLASQKVVKKLCFEEPSTSAQISSPEGSPTKYKIQQSSSSSSLFSALSKTSSSLEESGDSADEHLEDMSLYLKELSTKRTFMVIEKYTRFYLGLPEDTYFIVKMLESEAKVPHRNILIVLKKIRLNDPFFRLSLDFGLGASTISKIFGKDLITLAAYFKNMVYWPQPHLIKLNLPIGFRVRYSSVQSIIDCFEIQIEQPTNSLHQSLTWSEYKKANTLKYLISSTPDGIVNFVSEGYGGRISDSEIVKDCGYLDVLPKNSGVMADRGFKQIDAELTARNCTLIRPPSVATGTKSTKEEIKLSGLLA